MLGGNSLWLFAMQFTFLFSFFLRKGEEGVREVFSVIIKCIGSSLFRTVLGCSGEKYALHSREVFG